MNSRQIPLRNGLYAIVDAEDYAYLSLLKWYVRRSADNFLIPYRRIQIRSGSFSCIPMSKFVVVAGGRIGYRNGNPLDVRKGNLLVGGSAKPRRYRRARRNDIARVVEMTEQGLPIREIATRLALGVAKVRSIQYEAGSISRNERRQKATPEIEQSIKDNPASSNRALAERLGISHVAVLYLRRRLGLPAHPVGRPKGT